VHDRYAIPPGQMLLLCLCVCGYRIKHEGQAREALGPCLCNCARPANGALLLAVLTIASIFEGSLCPFTRVLPGAAPLSPQVH
jgi:hypothetical protein